MFTKKTKRYLMLLAALGLIAIAAGSSGTFAGFNAEVANANNTFQTGTLFLHDNGGVNTCTSESDANNANTAGNGCDVLFPVPSVTPGQTYTANLTLSNAGTLNASDIRFKLGTLGCVDSKPSIGTVGGGGLTGSVSTITITNLSQTLLDGTDIEVKEGANTQTFTVSGGPYAAAASVPVTVATQTANFSYTTAATISLDAFGGALCSQLVMNIQEYTDDNFNVKVTNTCAFPADTLAVCPATPVTTLDDAGFGSLQSLQLGSGTASNTGTDLTAGHSRYFTISILAPAVINNNAQNDQAKFDLLWHIDQA